MNFEVKNFLLPVVLCSVPIRTIFRPLFNFFRKKRIWSIFLTNFNFGGTNLIWYPPDGLIWYHPVRFSIDYYHSNALFIDFFFTHTRKRLHTHGKRSAPGDLNSRAFVNIWVYYLTHLRWTKLKGPIMQVQPTRKSHAFQFHFVNTTDGLRRKIATYPRE